MSDCCPAKGNQALSAGINMMFIMLLFQIVRKFGNLLQGEIGETIKETVNESGKTVFGSGSNRGRQVSSIGD